MPQPLPPLGVLGLIGRSFKLLGAQFGFLFPLAFVPAAALAALSYLLIPDEAELARGAAGFGAFLAIFLNVVIGFIVTGVMTLAGLDAALGKRHTVVEYLSQTMRHIGAIVVLGVLLSIATGLGMLLLVVPGLYVVARFLPWAPAVVFENAGWSGLTRAQDLTEGYRWPLVGAALLLGLVIIVALLAFGPVFAMSVGSPPLAILIEGVLTGLYYALIAVFTALVYLRLREILEGISAREIAEEIA